MRKQTERAGLALLAVASIAAASCATTTFQSTWRAPDAQPLRFKGEKVLAVFVSKNETVRHRAEDTMAREMSARGAQGVPSYTVLSQDEVRDLEKSRGRVDKEGFAGAVVMRIVSRETEYTYEPPVVWAGPHYRHFWGGYWGWGWGSVWDPGYMRADRVVSVETLVYSFKQDELVWAGVSQTVNPDRVEGLVTELAGAVSSRMQKEGLVGKT
jgi:hypothetical protein